MLGSASSLTCDLTGKVTELTWPSHLHPSTPHTDTDRASERASNNGIFFRQAWWFSNVPETGNLSLLLPQLLSNAFCSIFRSLFRDSVFSWINRVSLQIRFGNTVPASAIPHYYCALCLVCHDILFSLPLPYQITHVAEFRFVSWYTVS